MSDVMLYCKVESCGFLTDDANEAIRHVLSTYHKMGNDAYPELLLHFNAKELAQAKKEGEA